MFNSLISQFTQTMPTSYSFGLADIITVLLLSFVLSMIIAITYINNHSGISYSKSFVLNLIVLSMLVACVMLIVGSNIARAFTLIGALSIVRFRNAIKDTLDIGFIFFSMAVGMACGTRFYLMAVTMTFIISAIIYLLTCFDFGQKNTSSDLLKLTIPLSFDYEKILNPILKKNLKTFNLISINNVSQSTSELNFSITLKKKKPVNTFLESLRDVSEVSGVELFKGDSIVEI